VYSSLSIAVNADRLRELREQAARDRLVIQARRARREAAAAGASLRRRPWSRWRARRPAAAMTDRWASALSMGALSMAADPGAEADDRQPAGGRAS